jgi:hypothetical protein
VTFKRKKELEDKYTLREILDFAETRGMNRNHAYHELLALFVKSNQSTYTARIRAILEEME